MNSLAVQNPHHKCDMGNMNYLVTDKRQYLTKIIILRL